jgi:hypothetical protein
MANYFILSSLSQANIRNENIFGISNITLDVTSSNTGFSLPDSSVIVSSTVNDGIPVNAVALALSSRSLDSSGEISLKVVSPTSNVTYNYFISSLPYYTNFSSSIPADQNLIVFVFPAPFEITSDVSLSYELSASRGDALSVVGDIVAVDRGRGRAVLNAVRPANSFSVLTSFGPFNNSNSIYLSGGSYYIDNSRLTVVNDLSTKDFTLESWVYPAQHLSAVNSRAGDICAFGANIAGRSFVISQSLNTNNRFGAIIPNNNNNGFISLTSNSTLPLSVWSHVALVKSLSTCLCYLNGELVASATNVNFNFNTGAESRILSLGADFLGGNAFRGYISDTRIVSNTAIYTGSNFPLPSAPLTVAENTIFHLGSGINIDRCNITPVVSSTTMTFTSPANVNVIPTGLSFSRQSTLTNRQVLTSNIDSSFFSLSNDFTLATQFQLHTGPPTGNNIYGIFAIANRNSTSVSGVNLLINSAEIQLRVNNDIYGAFAHNLPAPNIGFLDTNTTTNPAHTYICTKKDNTLFFFWNGVYQTSSALISGMPVANTVYIGSGNNATQATLLSTTLFQGVLSSILLNNTYCIYTQSDPPTSSNDFPSSKIPGTVLYITKPYPGVDLKNYNSILPPSIDDMRISTPVYSVNVINPLTSINYNYNYIYANRNLYINNNASVNQGNRLLNSVIQASSLSINNNSFLNISSVSSVNIRLSKDIVVGKDSQFNIRSVTAAAIRLGGGIDVADNGNFNIIGNDKFNIWRGAYWGDWDPGIQKTLNIGLSTLHWRTPTWYAGENIIFNLSKWNTNTLLINEEPQINYAYTSYSSAVSALSTGYHLARIISNNVEWSPFGNIHFLHFTPRLTQTKYQDLRPLYPEFINVNHNIKLIGMSSIEIPYSRSFICGSTDSKINIENIEMVDFNSPFIDKTGIVCRAGNNGNFSLKKSIIRDIDTLPENIPASTTPIVRSQAFNTFASDNFYSLYTSPNIGNNFITPDMRNTALTGSFTIDFWTYTLGSTSNSDGVIFNWGETSTGNAAVVNTYSRLLLRRAPNNSLKLSYSDNTTGDFTDIISKENSLMPGVWYNIAITCTDHIIKLWIDGILIGSGYINDIYPIQYSTLSGEAVFGTLTIGGTNTAEFGYDGYIFDFRINLQQSIEPPSAGVTAPAPALSTDYFRLNKNSTALTDSSIYNRNIANNLPDYVKMVKFSPFSQPINNTTITDNIFVFNKERNIYLHHTTLSNVMISGNTMLSCTNTNIHLDNISAVALTMKDNFLNPPVLSANQTIIIKNCSSADSIVGGVHVYNNVLNPGIQIKGKNQGKIGNISSYNNKHHGIQVEPIDSCKDTLFINITSLENEYNGVNVTESNTPLVLSSNNVLVNSNRQNGIIANNIEEISNINFNNNYYSNLFIQKNTTPCNIKNITSKQNNFNIIYTIGNEGSAANAYYFNAPNLMRETVTLKELLDNDTFKYNNFTLQYWINPGVQRDYSVKNTVVSDIGLSSSQHADYQGNVFLPAGVHSNYFHLGIGRTAGTDGTTTYDIRNNLVFAWWNPSALRFLDQYGDNQNWAYTSNYSYYVSNEKLPLNTWSHVAVSIDNLGNIRMFINGIQVTKKTMFLKAAGQSGYAAKAWWNQTSGDRIIRSNGDRPSFVRAPRNASPIQAAAPDAWGLNNFITNFSIGRINQADIRAKSTTSNYIASQGLVVQEFDQDLDPNIAFRNISRTNFIGLINNISVVDNFAYTSNFTPYGLDVDPGNILGLYPLNNTKVSVIRVNSDNSAATVYRDSVRRAGIVFSDSESAAVNIEDSLIEVVDKASILFNNTTISELAVNNITANSTYQNILLQNLSSCGFDNTYATSNLPLHERVVNANININNSKLNNFSFTNLLSNSAMKIARGIAYTNFNQISGKNITYFSHGHRETNFNLNHNISSDTVPSEQLTPKSRDIKLVSSSKFVAVDVDQVLNQITVYVRKSTAANGSAYNGSDPRLILKANPSIGIYDDIVLDTMPEAAGSYVQLSGAGFIPAAVQSVYEFYVDCDGTAGWIDIDNWEAI